MTQTVIEIAELRKLVGGRVKGGDRIAFVPTMGALHEGHMTLIDEAKRHAECVVMSIFVNPKQFGPSEDFAKYPRTLAEDLEKMSARGVNIAYLPTSASMYPERFSTYVVSEGPVDILCGATRPGHFKGVLTVVMKLFQQVSPDVAVFGKKDYQQWRLIEAMARDLDLPIRVIGAAIAREADGLAMSSRNRYLSEAERRSAPRIYAGLRAAESAYAEGERKKSTLVNLVTKELGAEIQLEYCEVRNQFDLRDASETLDAPSVVLVAARVGTTRLIDNLELGTA